MRHRFTPASPFATTTRALEMRGLRNLSSTRNSCPGSFLGGRSQHSRRRLALQTRVLAQRRVGGRANRGGIGGLLVGCCAGHRRSQRDHGGRVCVAQPEVLGRRRFLLAAVAPLGSRGVGGPLATALRAVQDAIGGSRQRQGAGGDPARVALRRHPERRSGVWQAGEPVMNPRVGLGLAQSTWPAVQRLERIGLLVDEEEEPLVCHL